MPTGGASTSPASTMASVSNGEIFWKYEYGRISDDCARISRGPSRAPDRYEVPLSYGTPSIATSTPRRSV
jgi:hypothetical protein